MSKKSQISIFVTIATIIIIVGVFYATYTSDSKKEIIMEELQLQNDPNFPQTIKDYVDSCLERQSEYAINWVLASTGYYSSGNYETPPIVPFSYDGENKVYFPREELPNYIRLYLLDVMDFCIDDFKYFLNYDLDYGNISIEVEESGENYFVYMNYPITFTEGERELSVENFFYIIEGVPIDMIENNVNGFIDEFGDYSDSSMESFFDSLKAQKGFDAAFIEVTNNNPFSRSPWLGLYKYDVGDITDGSVNRTVYVYFAVNDDKDS